jgi:hypothetical protein
MRLIRTAGLLMLGLALCPLASSPASAQSKDAMWKEYKKEIKQACGEYWKYNKSGLWCETKEEFVNDQCWPGARGFTKWTDSSDDPQLTLRRINCPHGTREVLLNYRFPDGKLARTCAAFR